MSRQSPFLGFYLSKHIKQKRESLRLSTQAIADSVGLSLEDYLDLEAGSAEFTPELIQDLSLSLNLETNDLLALESFANIAQVNALAAEFFKEGDDCNGPCL